MKTPASAAGKKGKCPHCQAVVQIPKTSAAAKPAPAAAGGQIEFACEHCGSTVKTPAAAAGKKGKCPHCTAVVQIPLTSTSAPLKESSVASKPNKIEFHCGSCAKVVKTPGSAAGKKGKCPHCGSVVQIPLKSNVVQEASSASPIEFPCPSCRGTVRSPASTAGKKGKCPHCQLVVKIPDKSQPLATEAPLPAPAAPAGGAIVFACPGCSHEVRSPASSAGKKGKCPKCSQIFEIPQPSSSAAAGGLAGGLAPLGGDQEMGLAPPSESPGSGLTPLGPSPGLTPLGDSGSESGLTPLGGGGGGGLTPLGGGGLTPLGTDDGLTPLGESDGLTPLGGSGGLTPLGGSGDLTPLGGSGQGGDDIWGDTPAAGGSTLSPAPLPAAAPKPTKKRSMGSRSGLPWERGEGFLATLTAVLFNPMEAFSAMRLSGGMGGPIGYGLTGFGISAVIGTVWSLVLVVPLLLLGGGDIAQAGGAFVSMIVGVGIRLIFGFVAWIVGVMILSAMLHVMLMAFGAKGDFERTLRVVCYVSGSMQPALAVIPPIPIVAQLVGLAGFFWHFVLLGIGFDRAHGIGVGRSFGAVFLTYFLTCCVCAGIVGAGVAIVGASMSEVMDQVREAQMQQMQQMQ